MEKLAKVLFIPTRSRDRRPTDVDTHARERLARWGLVTLVLGGLGLYWAGVMLYQREEEASLRALPATARRDLYTRTLDELDTVCRVPAAGSGKLLEHCVSQAQFVRQLPECAEACQRAVARVLPRFHR